MRRQSVFGWPCACFMLAANATIASGAVGDDPVCVEASRFLEPGECLNERLPELNRLIFENYGKLKSKLGRPIANRIQIPFMRMRLLCKADVRCEYRWQILQLAALYQLVPAGRRELPSFPALLLPQPLTEELKAGECALSQAAAAPCGPAVARDGECNPKPNSSLRIAHPDNLRGISARDIGAAARARPGDPILACKGAPQPSCAAGDTPGNHWTFTNTRTGVTWQMIETNHVRCLPAW